MLVAAGLLAYAGRELIFFYDEWALILGRREWDANAFLRPHNEHLILVTVAVFKALFVRVGLEPYWVYRVFVVGLHLLCVALCFQLTRRRVPDSVAIAACVPLLFFGSAYEVLLAPMQVHVLVSVAAGLGMLLMLDRSERRADVMGGLLLGVSIASSTFGLPFAVAWLVESLFPRVTLRRLLIAAAPLAAYGIWLGSYAGSADGGAGTVRDNLAAVPGFILEAAAGTLAALAGLSGAIGWVLLAAAFFFGFPSTRMHLSTRFLSLFACVIAFGR